MGRKIADPSRDLSEYYDRAGGRVPGKRQMASLQMVTDGGAPVPVRKAENAVQLTPIIQPVAFVPYSTQKQPLYTATGEFEEYDLSEAYVDTEANDGCGYTACAEAAPVVAKKKKVSGAAIALIILSILSVAVMILGKFVSQIAQYIAITADGKSAYEVVEAFVTALIGGGEILDLNNLVPAAIALCGVFAVITFLASLIRICKKGACVVAKISTFFGLLFALVAVGYNHFTGVSVGYGMYAVAGLALIMMLIAYIAKNDKKAKK